MVLRLSRRRDVEFESYSVRSGETHIGVITRHALHGQRVWWSWSIGTVHVPGDGQGTPTGSADTREAAMEGFAARWRLWLKAADLSENTPLISTEPDEV
ncbi:MAG TPA: hypothetical protein VIQ29_23955 [Ancylobacter sp.]